MVGYKYGHVDADFGADWKGYLVELRPAIPDAVGQAQGAAIEPAVVRSLAQSAPNSKTSWEICRSVVAPQSLRVLPHRQRNKPDAI